MTNRFSLLHFAIISSLLAGCAGDDSPFNEDSTVSDEPISDKNFNLFVDPIDPAVIDDDGGHGGVQITLTVQAGDRFNSKSSSGTVYFKTEWGILETNSCQISLGTCSVTWTSDSDFSLLPPDLINTFTAYTEGEESYVDLNGNKKYDDGDGNYIRDLDEPFLDINHDGSYTLSTDEVIDVDNNGIHTPGDGLFNGKNCDHTTLCSSDRTIMISDRVYVNLDQRTPPPDTAPTANITAPADAADLTAGGSFTFTVDANDAEDGAITATGSPAGTIISWDSDQPVPGTGFSSTASSSIDTTGWTVGAHVITVTVTDSDSNSVTDTITITR